MAELLIFTIESAENCLQVSSIDVGNAIENVPVDQSPPGVFPSFEIEVHSAGRTSLDCPGRRRCFFTDV